VTPRVLVRKDIVKARKEGVAWPTLAAQYQCSKSKLASFIASGEDRRELLPRNRRRDLVADVERANRALTSSPDVVVESGAMPAVSALVRAMRKHGVDRVVVDLVTGHFELRTTTRHELPVEDDR